MERREAIRQLSIGLGITLSYGSLVSIINGCKSDPTNQWVPKVMNVEQGIFLKDFGDFILPRTDTPGADDVMSHQFIDKFADLVYGKEAKKVFLTNIDNLMNECKEMTGKSFPDLDHSGKTSFIQSKEDEKFEPSVSLWGRSLRNTPLPFYRQLKSMVLMAYFSSKEVGEEVLDYNPVPGFPEEGCKPLEPEEKV